MTLKEILDDIDRRMPNQYEEAVKVLWLNTVVLETYKETSLLEGLTFDSVRGQCIYPLPPYIAFDMISAVTTDALRYVPKRAAEDVQSGVYYRVPGNFLGIYPSCDSGEITILYSQRPLPLLTRAEMISEGKTETDFENQTLPLEPEYGELLKYGVFIIMSEAREDISLANNYKMSYNALLSRAKQERFERDGKYPVVRNAGKVNKNRFLLRRGGYE